MIIRFSEETGKLFINDREVKFAKFMKGGKLRFPIKKGDTSKTVISDGKNIVTESSIVSTGSIWIGDY